MTMREDLLGRPPIRKKRQESNSFSTGKPFDVLRSELSQAIKNVPTMFNREMSDDKKIRKERYMKRTRIKSK